MTDHASLLKQIRADARPYVEQWVEATRKLNGMFMDAWRSGAFDATWADFWAEHPDLWLTYFVRARGMGDIKIGKTRHLKTRVQYIFSGCSRGVDLIACYPSNCEHEGELKDEFVHLRLCGEWFRPGDELLTHLQLIGCDPYTFTNVVPAHHFRRHPERLS